ncbi:MAG: hypothetical protein HY779_01080 [Rubrobacteridae bacterium]|nr:hypothetical protein [Rubrobacteridae bacterium]
MDLGKMISVLWARRVIIAIGVLAGLAISFLAVNTVHFSMNASEPFFSYSPRVQQLYSTTVRMVLDEPNFGLGRVGIIAKDERRENRDLSKLAAVYSYLVVSDDMISALKKDLDNINGEIKAVPVEELPIIEITVKGSDPEAIRKVANEATSNFMSYFKNEQVRNEVPPADRISVRTIGEPSLAAVEQSRRKELAFIFFLLPIVLAGLLAFVLENFKNEQESKERQKENSEAAVHHAGPARPIKRTV